MSDGNRDRHDAIVAVAFVTFALIFGLIGYFEGFDQGQGGRESVYTNQHHESAEDRIQDRCIALPDARQAECIKEAIETSGEYQRAEKDLSAQQQMAEWAKWMLVMTVVMAAITMFGVVFVWQTLVATRAMALDAQRIGEAQVRAYLTVGEAEVRLEVSRDRVKWRVDASFRNSGNSPASGINAKITHVLGQHVSAPIVIRDLPAGLNEKRGIWVSQEPDSLCFHLGSETKVVFRAAIEVEYRDVFNKQREGVFEFFGVFDLIDGETYGLSPVGRATA